MMFEMNLMPDYAVDAFRLAMRQTAQTVAIITIGDDRGPAFWGGMTVSSMTSVSMTPPMVLVCVNQEANLWPRLAVGGNIGVNILAAHQSELADLFARSLPPEQRFDPALWMVDGDGVPFLTDALGVVFGRIEQMISAGTHSIILCAVMGVQADPTQKPLIYHDRSYKTIEYPQPT